MPRLRAALLTVAASLALAAPALAAPGVVRDVRTGSDPLGALVLDPADPIQDYVQADTQAEPSIAVNPRNPNNVITP